MTTAGGTAASQTLDELSARANQQDPVALVPPSDEMVLVNGQFSIAKTNVYRSLVGQAPVAANANATQLAATYCQDMVNIQPGRNQLDMTLEAGVGSPVAAVGNNLATFMGNRLSMSFTNLNCQNFGLTNPVNGHPRRKWCSDRGHLQHDAAGREPEWDDGVRHADRGCRDLRHRNLGHRNLRHRNLRHRNCGCIAAGGSGVARRSVAAGGSGGARRSPACRRAAACGSGVTRRRAAAGGSGGASRSAACRRAAACGSGVTRRSGAACGSGVTHRSVATRGSLAVRGSLDDCGCVADRMPHAGR